VQIITIDGSRTVVPDDAVGALRDRLRGRLLMAGDPDYDRARVVSVAKLHRCTTGTSQGVQTRGVVSHHGSRFVYAREKRLRMASS
jgi:hypothetical protein